ncbi:Zinc finger, PMZ-type [Sesbania bispinosa]|nr:Zinc finger, PMZ-type [Sesbania bispinosa]
MKGKAPKFVITDGDRAMRNAIRIVFPNATHRLCAWHLIRNATSNVGKHGFSAQFTKCMLGDYEIGEFKRKWENMIYQFDVQEHMWVIEMYEKRSIWPIAYIRGKFFAGLRTTSRCEGFHSQLKKFVNYKNNLTEFIHHLNRCLNYVRQREIEADFACVNGDQPLETSYRELENSASAIFTCDVFFIFRRILTKAAKLKVVGSKTSFSCTIYPVRKNVFSEQEWFVSFEPRSSHFKCCCRRMESYGIPCDHIVAVMVYLDFNEVHKSLVLFRWTKKAKEEFWKCHPKKEKFLESLVGARHAALLKACDDMCSVASLSVFGYYDTINKVLGQTEFLKARNKSTETCDIEVDVQEGPVLRDPLRAWTKGCTSTAVGKGKGKRRCTTCRRQGHNRSTCPVQKRIVENRASSSRYPDIGMSECNYDGESMEDDGSDNEFS